MCIGHISHCHATFSVDNIWCLHNVLWTLIQWTRHTNLTLTPNQGLWDSEVSWPFDFVLEPSLLGEFVTKSSTLNIVFSVTNFTLSRSILIVNCSCRITNTKCNPNTSCRSLSKKKLDSLDLQHCNYCHLLSVFSSTIQSFLTTIHFLNDRMLNIPKFDEHKLNWDENICKHMHKKCY